ncbi:MAG: hypothetical protein ACRC1K_11455 [Planctomycetia bacterium]
MTKVNDAEFFDRLLRGMAKAAAADPQLRSDLLQLAERLNRQLTIVDETPAPSYAKHWSIANAAASVEHDDETVIMTHKPAEPTAKVETDRSLSNRPTPRLPPQQAPSAAPSEPPKPILRPIEPLPPLLLGQSSPDATRVGTVEVVRTTDRRTGVADDDLPLVEKRCKLKAVGARWSVERQTLIAKRVDYAVEVSPRDREHITQARQMPGCLLWMMLPTWPLPKDSSLMETVAECFLAAGEAADLLHTLGAEPDAERMERALAVAAEAQSMLRIAVKKVNEYEESDQLALYHWLKNYTNTNGVYIQRFMRLDDPADPSLVASLRERITQQRRGIETGRDRGKEQKRLLGKVKFIAKQLADADENDDRWRTLATTVDELVSSGVAPSNRDLRDSLLPLVDEGPTPDDAPKGFLQAMRETERFLAQRPPAEDVRATSTLSSDVEKVRRLLSGKCVILIGGERRQGAEDRLVDAFGLAELEWVATREHESIERFRAPVYRPDVAVVLLAIRWASHSYSDVEEFCIDAGKPLVRLPAGYHPNQVADMILKQCGSRLASAESLL